MSSAAREVPNSQRNSQSRSSRWAATLEWPSEDTGFEQHLFLYDLDKDPYETNNLFVDAL